jgi:hypothetical protein
MRQDLDVFDQFMTDTLTLHKPDGRVFENIRACVGGKGGILIEDVRLPIELGDTLTRTLPNGLKEDFIVDDPGFCATFSGIAAHFQVKVRRAGSGKKSHPPVHNVFYGAVGNLAQNSEHFSQTVSMETPPQELAKLVSDLTAHLDELNLDTRQKQRAEAQIATLKAELTGDPDPAIVCQAGRTLRNITEGAIGSLLATAAQPGIWHWIHQTLASF